MTDLTELSRAASRQESVCGAFMAAFTRLDIRPEEAQELAALLDNLESAHGKIVDWIARRQPGITKLPRVMTTQDVRNVLRGKQPK